VSTISTAELSRQLGKPGLVLVDVRCSAAYNGWRLGGEARGGHLPGAVSLPLSWTKHLSEPGLGALLKAMGITPEKTVVVYGYNAKDSAAMARRLRDMGYDTVRTYAAGLRAWATDDALPLERLARYQKLVYPAWVRDLVQGKHPETYPGRGFVLVEVGDQERSGYEQGHIPGALYLDTNELEAGPLWNRVPDKDLEAVLLAHGLTNDITTVLYGRDTTPAARAAVLMLYAGVEDVRLLDGGLQAWTAAGHALQSGWCAPAPGNAFGRQIPVHPEYIVDLEEARALLVRRDAFLVSIRSWAEYTGETSGYDRIEPKGRIAGARWGHAGSDPSSMDHFRNVDNTMRSYDEIAANWRAWGITPEKRVAFYCGTGWRASEAFFCAYLMGWDQIAVYDGGWSEWSADPANPIESGTV
jgi:thiosulfate/3-mercaptopyruvate sulfurtransferase